MDYRRFISYLYSYQGEDKGVNVGYIRCEQRQGFVRFTMSLNDHQGIEDGKYKVYLYRLEEDSVPIGYILDEIILHDHSAELRLQTNSSNVWNTGRQLLDFDGVLVRYDTAHNYMSQWSDRDVSLGRFITWQDLNNKKKDVEEEKETKEIKEEKEEKQTKEAREAEIQEENSEEFSSEIGVDLLHAADITPDETTMSAASTNGSSKSVISPLTIQLMENRPKLPDFENHEIYDCVRIMPNDIGMLEMENWRLGVNSFLTHGYYNYKYLLLGKIRFQDGVVKAVLGVPGVFDNKEQYIAKIFGFDVFVPLKHTNIKTGNFGYWITELT